MIQLWKMNGYCPECYRSYVVMEAEKINAIMQQYQYYTKMVKDNRPVVKCNECGAYYEFFVVKPVYTRPE